MAKNKSTAPDAKYVEGLKNQLQAEFGERDSLIRQLRTLRFMDQAVEIPEAYQATTKEVRTPIAFEQLQRVVATLTVNYPVLSVPPLGPGDKEQRESTRKEKWLNAALKRMEQEAERPVFRMFVDNLVADGLGVVKLVYKPDHWSGYPERAEFKEDAAAFNEATDRFKKSAKFPFAWRDVDPLTFYPVVGEEGLEACLEVSEKSKRLLMRRYDLVEDESGKLVSAKRKSGPSGRREALETDGSAEVIEYWDRSHFVVLVDGRMVKAGEHGYDRVPYFAAYGEQSASRDPKHAGISAIYAIRWLVPLLDSLLTMKQNAAFLYAYPTPFIRSPLGTPFEGGEDGRPQMVEWTPGKMIPLFPGEEPGFVQWRGSPPDLDELIAHVRQLIDRAGLASVMYGTGPGAGSSGYMVNQLMNAARVKYDPIVKNAEAMLERLAGFMLELVEKKVGEEVFVWVGSAGKDGWIGLSGDDVRGYYACEVRMEPLLPTDDIAQGMFGASMAQAGIVSKRWTREAKPGIANPEEMEEEILAEEWLNSGEVRNAVLQAALTKAGVLPAAPIEFSRGQMGPAETPPTEPFGIGPVI